MAIFAIVLIAGLPLGTAATVTKDTVTAHGWNSCSKGWYKTGGSFMNYCPFCHAHGSLHYNPKGTYEGEWTCARCDADFCNCGRCKASGSGVYLKKAVVVKKLSSDISATENGTTAGSGLIHPVKLLKDRLSIDWLLFR